MLASGKYSWQAAAHGPGGWSAWSDAALFEARAKLTTSDIAKYVDRMVLIEVNGFEDGKAFSASGSGFFISSDGRIVTNYHVIDAATEGTVTLNGGQKYGIASVLGYNKDQDLAVIRISGTGFPICTLGDSSKVGVGDPVVAIGSPLGIQNTVSEGIVSKLWEDGSLQITAPISPGSSGGALFNMYGEVIGVTTWKIRNGENMNLAVPVNLLQNLDTTLNLTLAQVFQKEYPGAAVLPAPSPLSPASKAVVSTLTPTLSWTVVPGATKYNVKVFLAPNGRPFLVDETVTGTSYTIPSGVLLSGVRYTWTVFAGNSLGWSANLTMPGSIYDPSFTVQAPVTLTPPSLLQPTEGNAVWPILDDYKVSFSWSAVAGATSYMLWIGSGLSGDESTNLYKQVTSTTSYTITTSTLVAGRTYTWAVAAKDGGGNIVWSADRHFSVVDNGGLSLLYPTNYSTIYTNPTMMWLPYSGASSYYIIILQGTAFDSATTVLRQTVSSTQYTLPALTLTRGLPYMWVVYAHSGSYTLAVSIFSRFDVSP